jgi:MFS family permease
LTAARSGDQVRLGIGANIAQFLLLVLVNALVGAMVGMERSILPSLARDVFGLGARTAILSFIAVFGVAKALTNSQAGRLSDRFGRRRVLIAGWLLAVPVPLLLIWAPGWSWVLAANALLGVSQGLAWSTTVIMKIDLAGPRRRGLAMGLNECAGYLALAGAALLTAEMAERYGLRPVPFYAGLAVAALGLFLSVLLVRETGGHAAHESALAGPGRAPARGSVFWTTTLLDRNLSAATQAGLVNNLNDGMAWGLFPLVFAAAGMDLGQIGQLVAVYPATWAAAQLITGPLSDRIGRKWLVAAGMWVQAAGIGVVTGSTAFGGFASGSVLLGLGTAMVYPALLAAIGDVAQVSWRASAVGVYRFWRDLGYAIGALVAGMAADALGLSGALWLVAAITLASGLLAGVRMTETRPPVEQDGRGLPTQPTLTLEELR